LAGPKGLKKLIAGLEKISGGLTKPKGYKLVLTELKPGKTYRRPGFAFECAPTGHTPEALAFRISAGGKTLCYTGDARPSAALWRLCSGCDLAVADAGSAKGDLKKPHMTGSEAAGLPARRVLLSHLSAASAAEAAACRSKRVKIARDLMIVGLTGNRGRICNKLSKGT